MAANWQITLIIAALAIVIGLIVALIKSANNNTLEA